MLRVNKIAGKETSMDGWFPGDKAIYRNSPEEALATHRL